MVRDHWICVFGEPTQGGKKFLVAAVAHRNHRVSAQAGELGAPHRRSAKHFAKFLRLHFGQPIEIWVEQAWPRFELGR